ncbi:YHS domain-containing (seleno)protein [Marinoscillum sp. MHG1-6]|uniref:YHS domain-containing (seleno)protein n=1 Tax=Marinoscillum sp. MHG1-6 TaxID=2959627 RepID=UPI0021580BF9|nr:YHS domain-containing (seleno)protein [Marinoscillum sp. MHG1-6]
MWWIMISLLFVMPQGSDLNLNRSGLAIDGYDPVSYFQGKPKEGSSEVKAAYRGATYYFSSEANKKLFLANPENYLPQYGGWCAYAMGLTEPEKVKIDPETYKILDGKLYLFYNFWGSNTLKSWNENEAELKRNADANWKKIGPQ